MNKKGFSLVELLAIIVIMAVIALIALPVVTDIISDAKQGALKSTVEHLISSAENNCSVQKINGQPITYIYKLTEEGIYPNSVSMKGKLPTSGYLYVDGECNATAVNLSDGTNYINGDIETISVGKEKVSTSPVEETTKNYLMIVHQEGVEDSFVVPAGETAPNPQINGAFTNDEGLIKELYYGFISRELDKSKIERFITDMTAKAFTTNFGHGEVPMYNNMKYYIDYENGYSIVFYNMCDNIGGICNSATFGQFMGVENDENFIAGGGIIYNF